MSYTPYFANSYTKRLRTPGTSIGSPSRTVGRYLNRSAARIEARLKTDVGLPSVVIHSSSTTRTSRVVPAVVTVNSTIQKPSIPLEAAVLGYSGATLTIGR